MTAPRNNLRQFAFGLFFLLWVVITVWQATVDRLIASTGLIVVVALYMILKRLKQGTPWRWSPYATVFALYTLMRLLWLPLAPLTQFGSLDQVVFAAEFHLFLFFFLNYFQSWRQARMWENSLIGLAILFVFLEFYFAGQWYWTWWVSMERQFVWPAVGYRTLGGLLDSPSNLSAFFNLVIPIVFVRMLSGKDRSRKLIWLIAIAMFTTAQFLTSSRAGWASGAAGVGVALALYYFPSASLGDFKTRLRKFFTPSKIALLALVLVVGVAAGFWLLGQAGRTPGHGGRLDIWTTAIQVWAGSWLLGRGTGAFQLYYAAEIMAPPGFAANHAHNLFLQMGAEHGVAGVVVWGALLATAFLSWRRAWLASPPGQRDMLAAYAGVGTAVFFHSFTEFLFLNSLFSASALLVLCFVLIRDPVKTNYTLSPRKGTALVVLSLVVILWGNWDVYSGVRQHNAGALAGWENEWVQARDDICGTADAFPDKSYYQFECALAYSELNLPEPDESLLEEAITYQARGLEKDPYWPVHWANLAMLHWQVGNTDKAIEKMQRTFSLAPRNALFALNLGWMAEQAGRIDLADASYHSALELDPWLTESDYFRVTPLREAVRDRQDYGEFLETPDRYTLQAYRAIEAEDFDSAKTLLKMALGADPINAKAYILMGVVNQAQGRREDAWVSVQNGLRAGQSPQVYSWAAQVALAQGRQDEALRLMELAFEGWKNNIRFSRLYYSGVYHRYFLPSDLVPGFQIADLTPDMVQGLNWLSEHYDKAGEAELAEQVRVWLLETGWGVSLDQ